MAKILLYPVGYTDSLSFAVRALSARGISITDHPSPDVTHLLMDVPSFAQAGNLRSGQDIRRILESLPESICTIGGNLSNPALDTYQKLDLLQDDDYLCRNAAITAECAIILAGSKLKSTFRDTTVLILGWGRIGKHLSALLQGMGAVPSVCARKASDRAMIRSLGMDAVSPDSLSLNGFRLVFNTIPAPILTQEQAANCVDCLKIDLASAVGIPGEDVIRAQGLPGKDAPLTAGRLIANTILRKLQEDRI